MANFKRFSRYTGGLVTKNRSNQDFLILRKPLNLQPDAGDVFITVTQEFERRPDLIAAQVYDNVDLWWVIYEFNGIRDPLFDLTQGTSLRIPSLERVVAAIEELEG